MSSPYGVISEEVNGIIAECRLKGQWRNYTIQFSLTPCAAGVVIIRHWWGTGSPLSFSSLMTVEVVGRVDTLVGYY